MFESSFQREKVLAIDCRNSSRDEVLKYRSEIDGLRAFAVVPVVFFHAGFELFSGGFVGVDVFFVISGYLITTILINDLEKSRFSLLKFYERRARRIFPALFFVVICSIPAAWFLLQGSELRDFAQSLVAVSTFSSNILFWLESGYFESAAELKPLLHTWSLAVEEQFYVIFPLVLLVTWRFRTGLVISVLVATFLVSLALSYWWTVAWPSASFYLLPSRAWELLIGSLVAFSIKYQFAETTVLKSNFLSVLGFTAILFAVFFFDNSTPFPGLHALVPTIGTALVILFAVPGTWVQSVLSLKAFVGIGLISYSLYLWHHPVFAYLRHYNLLHPTDTQIFIALAVISCLAVFSYKFVERPFRGKGAILNQREVFGLSAAFLSALIACGVIGNSKSFVGRQIAYPLAYEPDREALRLESWSILQGLAGKEAVLVDANDFERSLWFRASDERTKLLVIGNSHSKDVFNVLYHSQVATEEFQLARFGIQIADVDEDFFEVPNYVQADVVVVATRFSEADFAALEGLARRVYSDQKTLVLLPNIFEFFDTRKYTLADVEIRYCMRSKNCDFGELVRSINSAYFLEFANESVENPYYRSFKRLKEMFNDREDILILDRMDYVCDVDEQSCFAIDERLNKYFYDYGHHTLSGAQFFAMEVDQENWLSPILDAIALQ